jgi:tRNA-specific 2-thiouridylase
MSGGVDSAVAAARCVAQGAEVLGISLRLADGGSGSCCSLDDFQDAAAVADRLGFPHYVFDYRREFERTVVQPFVAEYLAGRTPNPCARCNQHVKFGRLWEHARELGADRLATGHYARIAVDPVDGAPALRQARDADKDQSYFLFMLGAATLARTSFPVGDLSKAEVRDHAARLGLEVAAKPESMDVCFVPRAGPAAFVEARAPASAVRPGAVEDESGAVLARHDGVHRFTVGQRRGLGLGGGARRYVRRIDAATGIVTVSSRRDASRGLRASDVSWAGRPAPPPGTRLAVRIRHRHPLLPCRIESVSPEGCHVAFEGEGAVVTPGQAAVFYRGDVVLGGGWVSEEIR